MQRFPLQGALGAVVTAAPNPGGEEFYTNKTITKDRMSRRYVRYQQDSTQCEIAV
jgi:hypothetical protein